MNDDELDKLAPFVSSKMLEQLADPAPDAATVDQIMALADEYAERREHRGEDRTGQERAALRAAVEQIVAERDALRALLRRVRGAVDGLELGAFIKLMDEIDEALK